jgi:hypothetical protein
MQHLANKVGSVIVKHSRSDMKEIRETIVVENEMCGFENPNLFNSVVHCRLYSVSFPITASSAKFAVQCPLWLGHFTAIPLFRQYSLVINSAMLHQDCEIKVLR